MDRSTLWLAMAMIGGMMVGGSLVVLVDWDKSPPPTLTYCTDSATEVTPRCPPEPGSVVLAVWPDGSTATVLWTGKAWQIRVPGGQFKQVSAPQDWAEL